MLQLLPENQTNPAIMESTSL